MPKSYATLSLREEGPHVLVVTLNRPEVLNAISTQMGRDWLDLFTGLAADPGELRCIVLTGAGERAFRSMGSKRPRAHRLSDVRSIFSPGNTLPLPMAFGSSI